MERRTWLRRAAIIAAGAVAADQLELLDRLAPRRLFAAWPALPTLWGDGVHDDWPALQAAVDGRPYWDAEARTVRQVPHVRHAPIIDLDGRHYALSQPLVLRSGVTLRGDA